MIVNCPICSEILLPSDILFSTPCGHIFHQSCLNRWIGSNNTCPQCRQECSQHNIHRIYLPDVNFQDQDSLIERLNEINRQKIEYETKLKKTEHEKKALESDLKKKKKEFHKVVQRSRNIIKSGSSNIPVRHKNVTVNILGTQTQARSSTSKPPTSTTTHAQKKKRNTSRVQRSKLYFQRKRSEHRNNNNSTDINASGALVAQAAIDVELVADSPDSHYDVALITLSSEDSN